MQITGLCWSKARGEKEIAVSHGHIGAHAGGGLTNPDSVNDVSQVTIWKYPRMQKVAGLDGHTGRILALGQSPDGSTLLSAGADESLKFWKVFTPMKFGAEAAAEEEAERLARKKAAAAGGSHNGDGPGSLFGNDQSVGGGSSSSSSSQDPFGQDPFAIPGMSQGASSSHDASAMSAGGGGSGIGSGIGGMNSGGGGLFGPDGRLRPGGFLGGNGSGNGIGGGSIGSKGRGLVKGIR
jgi:hypothetical protein